MDKKINSKGAVAVRQQKEKQLVLEQLSRIPVVQVACEKAGISRATFYRLRAEDEQFRTSVEAAIGEGVAFINDMSESQLISLIKDKNWPAISFWLKSHHPSYKQRDFQAGFAITEDGDQTVVEVFADISSETKELRDAYLNKLNSHENRETKN